MKRGFIFVLFLLLGLFLGVVLTEIASRVDALAFLTWGQHIGIGSGAPLVIDLSILQLTFGLSIQVNLAMLLCLIGSLLFYHTVGKKI